MGSVTNLTDSTGSTLESYSYDVFGNPSTTSTLGNRFMFTGREYDAETGLYYYRARYYSPTLGRFLQRDPIGYHDSMNPYSFVGNNPINFIDPFGYVRWGDLGRSAWGLGTNVLGVIAGLGAFAIPEPTFSTKALGTMVLGKSLYGAGANLWNAVDAIRDKKKGKATLPSSLPNAIAELIAPRNQTAQKISDILDLATDLAFMRSVARAVEMAPGLYRARNGVIVELVSFKDPTDVGGLAFIYTVLDYARVLIENVVDIFKR